MAHKLNATVQKGLSIAHNEHLTAHIFILAIRTISLEVRTKNVTYNVIVMGMLRREMR